MTSDNQFKSNSQIFASLQEQAHIEGRTCVVSALIRNESGAIFAQKRSLERKLFPGCWDIVGGHVELNESLYEALAREIHEETGWELLEIAELIRIFDWEDNNETVISKKREFTFYVRVRGDLKTPKIEKDKFTQYLWIDSTTIELLKENRHPEDNEIYNLVKRAIT